MEIDVTILYAMFGGTMILLVVMAILLKKRIINPFHAMSVVLSSIAVQTDKIYFEVIKREVVKDEPKNFHPGQIQTVNETRKEPPQDNLSQDYPKISPVQVSFTPQGDPKDGDTSTEGLRRRLGTGDEYGQ